MSGKSRDEFTTLVEKARFTGGAPHRIVHLVSGIEQPDAGPPDDDPDDPEIRVARLVSLMCLETNRSLADVQTGSLIRLVIETDDGAVYCLPIQRNRHLVGIVAADSSAEAVDAADRVMIGLVGDVRRSIGLYPQNPGGLAQLRRSRYDAPSTGSGTGSTDIATTVRGAKDASFRHCELLHDVVAPDRLQWAAVVHGRELCVVVDCFADVRMERFFVLMGQEARRHFYGEFAATGCPLLSRVSRIVRAIVGGPVRRLVLNVEEGAVVLHRLDAQELLVGVTLDQERVAAAEQALRRLASALDHDAVECVGPNGPQ